jgi:hypothetical protein
VRRTLGELGENDPYKQTEPAQVLVQVSVPAAVTDWKRSPDQRKLAESLQTRNRLALESAFARGLGITGYDRNQQGDGCFLLGPVSGLEEPEMQGTESQRTTG